MKVSSRDLYAGLRTHLAPSLKAAGFERLKASMPGWRRTRMGDSTIFWFQASQDGWLPELGSRFTLEFRISADNRAGTGRLGDRFAHLLTFEELEAARTLNDTILRRLPELSPGHIYNLFDQSTRDLLMRHFRPSDGPLNPNLDPWLNYSSPHDVEQWGRFFLPLLPNLVSRFEARHLKDEGRGVVV